MHPLHRSSIAAALVALVGCGGADVEPGASPSPGSPIPGPTTPSPTPTADVGGLAGPLIACLEERGLEAEEGPIGDQREAFQVGVGTHPQFRFQAVVLGYEDRQVAAEDKRQVEEGAEQVGADLPEIRLTGRALIFILDEDIAAGDLSDIEDCARTAA